MPINEVTAGNRVDSDTSAEQDIEGDGGTVPFFLSPDARITSPTWLEYLGL